MPDWLLYAPIAVFSFAFVLGLLVFIHEMGHYSVARFFGVAVERFSIGFGKPVLRWRAKSGTEWVVSSIPLGGYVKFLGDAGAASNPDLEELEKIKHEMNTTHGKDVWKTCLHFKPLYQRFLVVLAGPLANFVLAVVLFMGLVLMYGSNPVEASITEIIKNSPAERAGFQVGDKIIRINGMDADEQHEAMQIITLRAGETLNIEVMRTGEIKNLTVVPERKTKKDFIGGDMQAGMIGVGIGGSYLHKTYTVPQAAVFGVKNVGNVLSSTGFYIGRLFQGKENGRAFGGLVKISAITGKIGIDAMSVDGGLGAKIGTLMGSLLQIAAVLSVGLGFANLMPIPVLDGGHLLYYSYEAIMRRPLSAKAQEIGFRAGFAIIVTLFFVLTWYDIGYVQSLFAP